MWYGFLYISAFCISAIICLYRRAKSLIQVCQDFPWLLSIFESLTCFRIPIECAAMIPAMYRQLWKSVNTVYIFDPFVSVPSSCNIIINILKHEALRSACAPQ
jgi:hypothetical protein